MKEKGILNSEISKRLSDLGHTDLIAIGDCGLPIYPEKKIDLALKLGEPKFIDVLETLLDDFGCEHYILASEIKEENPDQEKAIKDLLNGVSSEYISHEDFKKKLDDVKFVIRTGENTPYSNIILESKNIF
ncbi:MAG: D-ribose pyranase [Finegoldia magna]|jgi:D-ribose pyranase|uniref:D-ribose pyranase n=1 Tax=Anaerococcus sp. TaxID=1872515 RepID=UPI00280C1152|nr:D-ribose pyranase [Anaerococcus sp.]MDU2132795.1 D-ribose pyranase [Finegoldia magna]MDU0893809.1 D-ribose pyranase [Anaerococcus sp.]MDU2598711.1 D-ribose pyranase [Anaerococcus sp.]MDU3177102.1 D-ribose pyranase [Anaerococcus sp.]MDU4025203.1 D-ribose pyranase [Anaerococcus sp.]